MKTMLALLLATLLLGTTMPVMAAAAARDSMLVAQSDGMTLSQAVEQVRRQYNGRIVSAETRIRGNREIHYIKVLTEDGKLKTVQVPGRTLKKEKG